MGSWTGDAKALTLAIARWVTRALGPLGLALVGLLSLGIATGVLSSTSGGELTLDEPLTLSTSVLGGGETLLGRVTYRNRTSQPIALQRLTVAVRPPGGSNAGGPFLDLGPSQGPITLAPGESVTLAASRTLARDSALGAWRAYSTYEDAWGGWHDGNEVGFEVVAPLPPAAASQAPRSSAEKVPGYSVRGNQILDAKGQPHLFHGVARPSLEWSSTGDHLSAADDKLMAKWGANVVRIPLNQDFWLEGSASYDPTYRARIDQQIAWAHAAGLDVILDLHWSDEGDLKNPKPGQQSMADENSLELWREVADRYKNDPRVLFELYNEPHDVSWDVWRNGGSISNGSGGSYEAVGMQELTDAVRSTGATNVVLVGGLDWAYDLSGVPDHRIQGANVAYVTHTYEGPDHEPSDWDSHFGFLAATDPVIATEFGSTDGQGTYDQAFVDYAKAKGISWTAWAWYPGGSQFPALVSDWKGTPTASGKVVRAALESFAKAQAPAKKAPAAKAQAPAQAQAPVTPAAPAPDPETPGIVGALSGLGG